MTQKTKSAGCNNPNTHFNERHERTKPKVSTDKADPDHQIKGGGGGELYGIWKGEDANVKRWKVTDSQTEHKEKHEKRLKDQKCENTLVDKLQNNLAQLNETKTKLKRYILKQKPSKYSTILCELLQPSVLRYVYKPQALHSAQSLQLQQTSVCHVKVPLLLTTIATICLPARVQFSLFLALEFAKSADLGVLS